MSEPSSSVMSSEADTGAVAPAPDSELAEAEAKPLGLHGELVKTEPLVAADGSSAAGDCSTRARSGALMMLADYSGSDSEDDSDGAETVSGGPAVSEPSVLPLPVKSELGELDLQAPTPALQPPSEPPTVAADSGRTDTKELVTETATLCDVTGAGGDSVERDRDVTLASDITVGDETPSSDCTADKSTKDGGGDPPANELTSVEAVKLGDDVMDTSEVQAEADAIAAVDDAVVDREGLYRESLARPWSDDSESDSSESEESSGDSSSSESEVENKEDEEEEAPKDEKRHVFGPMTKGELCLLDLPPIDHLHISLPEEQCVRVGVVASIVGTLVVVQASPGTPALDIDSVLFLEKGRRPLGRVFDVMGQVQEPAYCVRFNAPEEIVEFGITSGADVYYAPGSEQHCTFVFVDALRKMRGTDASWWDSNEPPESCRDFSDDEEERNHKRQNRKRPLQASDAAPTSASTSASTSSPASRGGETQRPGGRGRALPRGGDGEMGRRQRPPWMPAQPRNPFYRAGPHSAGPSRPWGPAQHHHHHQQHHQHQHHQPQPSWTPPAFSVPPPPPAFPPPAYPLFGQPPPSAPPCFGQPPPPLPHAAQAVACSGSGAGLGGGGHPPTPAWSHAAPLTFQQPPPPPPGTAPGCVAAAPFMQFPPPGIGPPSTGNTMNQPPPSTLPSGGFSVNHSQPAPPSNLSGR